MKRKYFVVIMAGGIGSRFWPYSRNDRPKQFLDVLGVGKTLLQLTYERFREVCPRKNIYVVTNDTYDNLVREQLPDMGDEQILLEPSRRNTAPCIGYASYKIRLKNPNAVIAVTPADHAIIRERTFIKTIIKSLEYAEKEDILITLGITPNRPETGYGYIQYIENKSKRIKKVKTFTEKPQLDLAKKFIESGDFVWNAGIFIWNVNAITHAFDQYLPDIAETFESMKDDFFTKKEKASINTAYSHFRNISIDYGVMEKAENVFVILGKFGWSDLGSWDSLHDLKKKDKNQNVIEADAMTYDTHNSLIIGEKEKLIVVQGLKGYLIADCGDVLLICKKDQEKAIRQYVKDAKSKKGEKYV
jgi:mannose-1-phosphate guanylyltransferase